ncbi:FecR domain-containing protein [Pseudomonas kuykendallii]|uniref:FecR family protein n=1 Tax=Pseudomonas kuykendallii TaxID=1007099 RepID=A0A1H2SG03_9PSED|nr:FecR domain-containing protein [Pseudomonas kuykendallii]MCQ4270519.1 FecR domain-containing protein [Pseudomonas kuykendallii]SDW30512.1 FecR family protein [Pseudomonas kuykendallii]
MGSIAQPSLAVLQAAANWYLDLQAAPHCAATGEAHRRWLEADPAHRQAWSRMERLQGKLGGLPNGIAPAALRGVDGRRRASLKLLGLLLLGGGAAGLGWQSAPMRSVRADEYTAVGERRSLRLEDGGQVRLNSDTALDIRYGERLRELHLRRGEIHVQTAKDTEDRPFVVHTEQGSIRALGTRFLVRQDGERTQVRVLQHTVEVRPLDAPDRPLRVEAGQQLWYGATACGAIEPLEAHADAWLRGMLVVSDWALPRFIDELARYRPGLLSCDPALAGLRISGAFQLADSDAVLDNLRSTLPLRVRRLTRYWVRIEPA